MAKSGALRETWSPSLLRLATQLAQSPQSAIRERVVALWRLRPRPSEPEMIAQLRPLALTVARATATAMGEALGVDPGKVLQFSAAGGTLARLEGKRAVVHRLDGMWSGPELALIEAREEVRLPWLGPVVGHLMAMSGEVQMDGERTPGRRPLPRLLDMELILAPRALLLMRRSLVGGWLDDAHALGIELPEISSRIEADKVAVATAVGPLSVGLTVATLGKRRIRLTPVEAAALRRLLREPGTTVPRAELAKLLGVVNRTLDHVFVNLRDKLGDGLITTVYGRGYALETAEAQESATARGDVLEA